MPSNVFDDWWNGLTGFSLNSERAYNDIDPLNAKRLEPWMKACWNAAIEAAYLALEDAAEAASLKADPYVSTEDVLEKLKTS